MQNDPGDELPARVRSLRERQGLALGRIDAVLYSLGRQGVQRLSRSAVDEITAIALTAHNASLARLERELEALATDAERYLGRDPLFRTGAWVSRVNRIWLLTRELDRRWRNGALPVDLEPLVGVLRRRYEPVDGLVEVYPLGAHGWVTDSDFMGITIRFAAPTLGRVVLATVARPTMAFGTDPKRLLRQPVADSMTTTVHGLSHGSWVLDDVRLSSDGRMSLHGELSCQAVPDAGGQAYALVQVPDVLAAVDRIGAGRLDPLTDAEPVWVSLEIGEWGEPAVDDTQGRATVPVRDLRGAPLDLVVPLRPENNLWVDNLSALVGPSWQPDALFGRVTVSGSGRVRLEPCTAIFHDPVRVSVGRRAVDSHQVHLSLESLGRVSR